MYRKLPAPGKSSVTSLLMETEHNLSTNKISDGVRLSLPPVEKEMFFLFFICCGKCVSVLFAQRWAQPEPRISFPLIFHIQRDTGNGSVWMGRTMGSQENIFVFTRVRSKHENR
ncbi:hypothetical protein AVEN_168273-1 [Araneus ventricosus]|uniref:Uncharacterized protein n=1 Tax=Araneus ventricosus TaxID=182803 RepID=A0A4Y2FXS0_ARAVE|nr:hypothetical protein AVEN_168273-1 [Araneus ventricosus]